MKIEKLPVNKKIYKKYKDWMKKKELTTENKDELKNKLHSTLC